MADILTALTELLNKPEAAWGGQLVAGGALAGIVWKFFDKIEENLNEDTKLEIAIWLLGVKVGQKVEPWPDTFARLFDRVFGKNHLSLKCFLRSSNATLASCLIGTVLLFGYYQPHLELLHKQWGSWLIFARSHGFFYTALGAAGLLTVFDYISLLETRYLIGVMRRWQSTFGIIVFLVSDIVFTGITGFGPDYLMLKRNGHPVQRYFELSSFAREEREIDHQISAMASEVTRMGEEEKTQYYALKQRMNNLDSKNASGGASTILFNLYACWLPTFFTSLWLWLYAGSGFLLKFARRFDKSLGWFNRRFDIEKKPLSSIGLVAGALVVLVYWAAMIVSRIV